MRIISGYLKGKKIDFLKSATTRPLRDFVKESFFNIIKHSNLINVPIQNSNVLDLYSGIGSFGIECVSRGAKKITFVENNSQALSILKNNILQLKIDKKCKIFETKILSFLNQLKKKDKYEIIFFDPPFSENFFIDELKVIKNSNIYNKNHVIIIHRENSSEEDLSKIINITMIKKYGRSKIIFGNFNSNTV
ncbi:16S rRNA (guanine(966)-N(2))-methyltransferase RsmD [Pelagibacteraceae bacterium]|nr:16S rRNA (guanine(966)-N(2))-methyltransferase RsmD [Pelagibacteraceae bacterium]